MMNRDELIEELGRYKDFPVTAGGKTVLGVTLGQAEGGGTSVEIVVDGDDGAYEWGDTPDYRKDDVSPEAMGILRHALGLVSARGWAQLAECGATHRDHYVASVATKPFSVAMYLQHQGYMSSDATVRDGMMTFRVTPKGKALFGIKPKAEEQPQEGENP